MAGTSWISDNGSAPDVYIRCQGCNRFIFFNREEILDHKNRGINTSTPCRFCSYHPPYPPEPWKEIKDI